MSALGTCSALNISIRIFGWLRPVLNAATTDSRGLGVHVGERWAVGRLLRVGQAVHGVYRGVGFDGLGTGCRWTSRVFTFARAYNRTAVFTAITIVRAEQTEFDGQGKQCENSPVIERARDPAGTTARHGDPSAVFAIPRRSVSDGLSDRKRCKTRRIRCTRSIGVIGRVGFRPIDSRVGFTAPATTCRVRPRLLHSARADRSARGTHSLG